MSLRSTNIFLIVDGPEKKRYTKKKKMYKFTNIAQTNILSVKCSHILSGSDYHSKNISKW